MKGRSKVKRRAENEGVGNQESGPRTVTSLMRPGGAGRVVGSTEGWEDRLEW